MTKNFFSLFDCMRNAYRGINYLNLLNTVILLHLQQFMNHCKNCKRNVLEPFKSVYAIHVLLAFCQIDIFFYQLFLLRAF